MRIGILGAGGMGGTHARHYSRIPGVELFLFEIDPARAADFAGKFRVQTVATFEELLEKVDAIDVCLPTNFHAEYALKGIAAGKAVFVEKPLAKSLDEARAIVNAAEAAGTTLMVGHVVRYFPEFKRAHAIVKSGALGTLAAARTRRGGAAPRSEWFQNYDVSGGVLLDLAVHDFDWLRWTLGEVTAVKAMSVGLSKGTWPDYALTTLSFASGAVAHVESTWMDPGGGRVTFEVCGSKGMIEHDSRKTQIVRTSVAGSPTAMESPLDPADDPYYNQLLEFVTAARENRPAAVDGREAFASMAIAAAAVESAMSGKMVAPQRF